MIVTNLVKKLSRVSKQNRSLDGKSKHSEKIALDRFKATKNGFYIGILTPNAQTLRAKFECQIPFFNVEEYGEFVEGILYYSNWIGETLYDKSKRYI